MSLRTWEPGPHFKQATPTRKKLKARAKRVERKVVKAVRPQCVARDGFCIAAGLGPCSGASEWCHHEDRSRAHTRGSKNVPEYRHSTRYSFMACTGHHYRYDKRKDLTIDALSDTLVMDDAVIVTDLTTGKVKLLERAGQPGR